MLAGVIGWPVEHSRSPQIHTAAARACGVDLAYVRFPVRPGEGAHAARSMVPLGIRGLSVTMPHKEAVIDACDELTVAAQRLNAVNHLTNDDGRIVGNNTDGAGFVAGFEFVTNEEMAGKQVVVFGSGGAARAIVDGCARAGAASVGVIGRSPSRAESAASVAESARVVREGAFEYADVVVNATPVGMQGSPSEGESPFDVSRLRPSAIVVDIVYSPLVTPLLEAASKRGLRCVDGLAMLAGQAAEQFRQWTGVLPPLGELVTAAKRG